MSLMMNFIGGHWREATPAERTTVDPPALGPHHLPLVGQVKVALPRASLTVRAPHAVLPISEFNPKPSLAAPKPTCHLIVVGRTPFPSIAK